MSVSSDYDRYARLLRPRLKWILQTDVAPEDVVKLTPEDERELTLLEVRARIWMSRSAGSSC
jgi:hypothetical protein